LIGRLVEVLALPPIFYIAAGLACRDCHGFPPTREHNAMPRCPFRLRPLPIALFALAFHAALADAQTGAAPAPPSPAKAAVKDTTEEFNVETSDGASITAWYYPLPEDASPLGIVILLHDLGGSHQSVEPLARSLQAAGCAVVAPDLRGHGESKLASLPSAQDDQTKLLKRGDFEMMAASGGGRVRDQSGMRGDVECVRNWIVRETAKGNVPKAPLFVVGSGVGASVAAHWTAADASWPEIASGPQGGEVAGLVLISPTFAAKGFSLAPALATDAVRRTIPVLVIAGSNDRDATKVFDQMKRLRPREWYDTRRPPGDEKDSSPAKAIEASLMLFVHPASRSGDALATARSADRGGRAADPATVIPGFIKVVAGRGS
jgi:dienelactone hydrolase